MADQTPVDTDAEDLPEEYRRWVEHRAEMWERQQRAANPEAWAAEAEAEIEAEWDSQFEGLEDGDGGPVQRPGR